MALVAVGLFVLSAVVTLLVLQADRSPRQGPQARLEAEGAAPSQLLPPARLGVSDFLLEEPIMEQTGPYLRRPPTPRWSDQQVERYWVPLQQVVLDIVCGRSDERIDQIFQDVE